MIVKLSRQENIKNTFQINLILSPLHIQLI